jgi:hypothetical protein
MGRPYVLERPGAAPERGALAAAGTVGGSRSDGIHVAGAPPRAALLEPCPAGVVVTAGAAGVRAAGHALAPGARRLVRPGESVELCGAALSFPHPAAEGTRAAAAALLRDAAAGALPVAGPHLLVLTGPDAGARHALGPVQVLGRGRGADVRVADARASRRHARLRLDEAGAHLEDLGAKNGVRVNGVRLDGAPVPLRARDEIAIGDTLLALEDPGAAPAPEEPPAGKRRRRLPPHLAPAVLLALSAAALALAGSG